MKRQGDLLFIPVKGIPIFAQGRGYKEQKNNVLARGEVSGHLHLLEHGKVYSDGKKKYVKVEDGQKGRVVHPDHASLDLNPGTYEIRRQREIRPRTGTRRGARTGARTVVD